MLFGSYGPIDVSSSVLLEGCVSGVGSEQVKNTISKFNYGRTKKELEYDKKLFSIKCFNDHEMNTINKVCNLILPPNEFGSIEAAEVPELIEFMAKDIPSYESPIKMGLKYLDQISKSKHQKCNNRNTYLKTQHCQRSTRARNLNRDERK